MRSWPVSSSIPNEPASVPPSVYVSVSPLSVSVAVTARPMTVPLAVFSATVRLVLSPSLNVGAVFVVVAGVTVNV